MLRMGGCRTTTAAGTTTLSNERPRVAVCCVVSRLGSFLVFESSRVRRDGERERDRERERERQMKKNSWRYAWSPGSFRACAKTRGVGEQ